jgi:DNA-binding response OmpR family regulator
MLKVHGAWGARAVGGTACRTGQAKNRAGDAGLKIHLADDEERAMTLALAFAPAVVICDIDLPGANGSNLACRLRRVYGAAIWLVAQTHLGNPEERARSASAGFDKHLLKPIDRARCMKRFAASSRREDESCLDMRAPVLGVAPCAGPWPRPRGSPGSAPRASASLEWRTVMRSSTGRGSTRRSVTLASAACPPGSAG